MFAKPLFSYFRLFVILPECIFNEYSNALLYREFDKILMKSTNWFRGANFNEWKNTFQQNITTNFVIVRNSMNLLLKLYSLQTEKTFIN